MNINAAYRLIIMCLSSESAISREQIHDTLYWHVFANERKKLPLDRHSYPQEIDITFQMVDACCKKGNDYINQTKKTKPDISIIYKAALCFAIAFVTICDNNLKFKVLLLNQMLFIRDHLSQYRNTAVIAALEKVANACYKNLQKLHQQIQIEFWVHRMELTAIIKQYSLRIDSQDMIEVPLDSLLPQSKETRAPSVRRYRASEQPSLGTDLVQLLKQRVTSAAVPQYPYQIINAEYVRLKRELEGIQKNTVLYEQTKNKVRSVCELSEKIQYNVKQASIGDLLVAAKNDDTITCQRYRRGKILNYMSCGLFRSKTENALERALQQLPAISK